MKFTFKRRKCSGFCPVIYHDIKLNKICVGIIHEEFPSLCKDIMFRVYKNNINENCNPNCKWEWIELEYKATSIQDAKDFLNNNIEVLLKKWDLVKE